MADSRGPVVFASIYTAGVLLTVILAMLHDRLDEHFLRIFLPTFQVVITAGAIFSAWALQQHKRATDARDLAQSTEDAVAAVILSIDKIVSFVAERSAAGRSTERLFVGNAAVLRDELSALAAVPLTALKPARAAVALVAYRRIARQAAVILERCAQEVLPNTSTERVAKRLVDLRKAERELFDALGRTLPKRLDQPEYIASRDELHH